MTDDRVVARLVDAWRAVCHPVAGPGTSVLVMTSVSAPLGWPAGALLATTAGAPTAVADQTVDDLVLRLFREEGVSLVRLARLFVDDRNAAEDLVQEAFIRLARSAHRIQDKTKAAAYLRSIVLNLARDHNRRGLVSLRHQLPYDERQAAGAGADDHLDLREDQREVLEALRDLPLQQRNCVVLRHLEELGIAEVAAALRISENSVKTHLRRGMAALARQLGEEDEA